MNNEDSTRLGVLKNLFDWFFFMAGLLKLAKFVGIIYCVEASYIYAFFFHKPSVDDMINLVSSKMDFSTSAGVGLMLTFLTTYLHRHLSRQY